MSDREIVEVFESDFSSDRKNKTNKSSESVNIDTLEMIEKGVTIEFIENTDLPVFLYKTQITIHGNFPRSISVSYVGNYKNLFQNQNGSIGVKYNAIDYQKKKTIMTCLDFIKNKLFKYEINSNNFFLYSNVKENDLNTAKEKFAEMKIFMESKFPSNSIVGFYNCNLYRDVLFGGYLIVTKIVILAIYDNKQNELYRFLFNDDMENVITLAKVRKDESDAKYEASYAKMREAQKNEEQNAFIERKKVYEGFLNNKCFEKKMTSINDEGLIVYFNSNYVKNYYLLFYGRLFSIELSLNGYDSKTSYLKYLIYLNNKEDTMSKIDRVYRFAELIKDYISLGSKQFGIKYPDRYSKKPTHFATVNSVFKVLEIKSLEKLEKNIKNTDDMIFVIKEIEDLK